MSCLGMNPGRRWNPNLKGSYLWDLVNMRLNFGHSVNQNFSFDICNLNLLVPCQSQYIYNVPKLTSFSILGFFQLGVKLGFEFLGVSTNQKNWSRFLNFDFDEEKNPMSGSLKNYSSIESPNFPHQNWKFLESNSASIEGCTLQWRVSLAWFC